MSIMIDKISKEAANAIKNGVRFLINGNTSMLPVDLADKLSGLERDSAANSKLIFTLCISYGSRQEITSAVKAACRDACAGKLDPESLTEELFRQYMPNPTIPDPDLLIRTSGEMRLSDFMLWQLAFTELYMTPILWPDFSEKHLIEAITEYSRRDRRFGNSTSKKS
jgi:undecaprenyl diphosphate synthase